MKSLLATLCAVLILSSAAFAGRLPRAEGGGVSDRSDPNAPKFVNSTEITSFQVSFYHDGHYVIRDRVAVLLNPDTRPIGNYRFSAVREKGGARIVAEFSPSDDRLPCEKYDFTAPSSALDELHAELIANKLPEINGFSKRNSALGVDFSVDVQYASGETIRAYGRGGASCSPPVEIDFLIETFRRLVEKYAPAEQRLKPLEAELSRRSFW